MTDRRKRSLEFRLKDGEYDSDEIVTGRILVDDRGIYIEFDRFGTDHDQIPVMIDQLGGVPHVLIWADKSKDDTTHEISLKKAELPKETE